MAVIRDYPFRIQNSKQPSETTESTMSCLMNRQNCSRSLCAVGSVARTRRTCPVSISRTRFLTNINGSGQTSPLASSSISDFKRSTEQLQKNVFRTHLMPLSIRVGGHQQHSTALADLHAVSKKCWDQGQSHGRCHFYLGLCMCFCACSLLFVDPDNFFLNTITNIWIWDFQLYLCLSSCYLLVPKGDLEQDGIVLETDPKTRKCGIL